MQRIETDGRPVGHGLPKTPPNPWEIAHMFTSSGSTCANYLTDRNFSFHYFSSPICFSNLHFYYTPHQLRTSYWIESTKYTTFHYPKDGPKCIRRENLEDARNAQTAQHAYFVCSTVYISSYYFVDNYLIRLLDMGLGHFQHLLRWRGNVYWPPDDMGRCHLRDT